MLIGTDYNRLLKNLKKATPFTSRCKVALLADFASQHLVKALKAVACEYGVEMEIWEAEYDSISTTIYDQESPLYTAQFEYIFLFFSPFKLYREFSISRAKMHFAAERSLGIEALIAQLQEGTKAKLVVSNFAEVDDGVFGNFAGKTTDSFLYQLRRLNLELMHMAQAKANLYLVDVQRLLCWTGRANAFNPKLYVHADLVYDLDFLALLAAETVRVAMAIQGHLKKCMVLDLDNTLWGGIVGDDGLDKLQIGDLGVGKAFTNLQIWLLNLKQRGIILAVCSKNNEQTAKEVFLRHPEMILRLDDISVFVANWETKVDNLLFIQSVLNIGLDSMVFLDDNPFERAMVKQHLPEVVVPELPEDPAEYLPFLQSLNLFETGSYAEEDGQRTRQYQEEAGRASLQKQFTSETAFLESLNMQALVKPIDSFTCPRVAQLSQRSNQFNLRTVRYTEAEIVTVMQEETKLSLTVELTDKFGDYGLISAVIMEKKPGDVLFIDTWIMSCRVLKRGVEVLLLNEMVELAKIHGIRYLAGEYLPTAKNALVKNHYQSLSFQQKGDDPLWWLCVEDFVPLQNCISKTNSYAYER